MNEAGKDTVIRAKSVPLGRKIHNVGFVYLISDGEDVKIGFSNNPTRRLAQIQQTYPKPLELIYQFAGTMADELALHEKFSHLRQDGEWFKMHEDIDAHFDWLQHLADEKELDDLEEAEQTE
jgi:hypothetical protein